MDDSRDSQEGAISSVCPASSGFLTPIVACPLHNDVAKYGELNESVHEANFLVLDMNNLGRVVLQHGRGEDPPEPQAPRLASLRAPLLARHACCLCASAAKISSIHASYGQGANLGTR